MDLDLAQYFVDTASLAVLVAALVSFTKKHIWKLDGIFTVIASVVFGALLGLAGRALGFLDAEVIQALLFGASAGVVASGGWDFLSGLFEKRGKDLEQ